MQLNGIPTVDTQDLYPYYRDRGLSMDILKDCNSQEFKFIDGYGIGHFLLTTDITNPIVSFTVDARSVSLKVIRKLSLEHPNQTGKKIIKYITAEPKYDLLQPVVGRNYNVTIAKSLNIYGATTIVCVEPDNPPKYLNQVIADFLPGGYTLSSPTSGINSILSYDIPIHGMSVLDALDYLCRIYGLVWTLDGTVVRIWRLDPGPPSTGEILDGLKDPINDIQHSTIPQDIVNVNVAFPIYDYCRKESSEYYVHQVVGSGQGLTINVTDPLYPAVVNALGGVRNLALLQTRGNLIAQNLRGIARTIDYVAKHKQEAKALSATPISLSEVHGDFGSGQRSIYRIFKYPVMEYIEPPSDGRYADNWVGTLTDGYYGVEPSFIVTPAFAIDGRLPPGPQRVINLYNWNYGEEGFFVRVEWDCTNGRWIPIQQEYECPPETPPELPPPTEPVPPYPQPGTALEESTNLEDNTGLI